MLKLGLFLVIPYLAVASIATGAVDGTDTFDAIQGFVSGVSEQSEEVATAIIHGPGDLDHKVTVCHLPGGDKEKAHLLSVSMEALAAHEAHGDYHLSDPALLVEPMSSLCADSNDVVEEQDDVGEGDGSKPGKRAGQSEGDGTKTPGGPPEQSNAGGNGRGPHADD